MNDNIQAKSPERMEVSVVENDNDSYVKQNFFYMSVKFLSEEDRIENGIQKNKEKFERLKACEMTVLNEYQFESFKLNNFKKVSEQSNSKKSAIKVFKQESKLERLQQKVSSVQKKINTCEKERHFLQEEYTDLQKNKSYFLKPF
jgi:predicted  nucleic acid-binding Zn-ribbon protein